MYRLAKIRNGLTVYDAGLPRFPRNFTRDGIIAALLLRDVVMMRDQLRFCALHQGRQNDAHSGEEPGKIFHEFPGYSLRGKSTQFNGCDTTGLWLYGLAQVVAWSGDSSLVTELHSEIEAALHYVQQHLDVHGLLNEDPAFSGAEHFALKVTYWKDSVLVDRPNGGASVACCFSFGTCTNAGRSTQHRPNPKRPINPRPRRHNAGCAPFALG